jgi:hypothetical protein
MVPNPILDRFWETVADCVSALGLFLTSEALALAVDVRSLPTSVKSV